MDNRYAVPKAPVADPQATSGASPRYAGFWIRVVASLIDTVLTGIIIVPLLWWIYGPDYFWKQIGLSDSDAMFAGAADVLLNYVFPAAAIILFWIARAATPGKMMLSMKIVDAATLGPISKAQAIGRYFSYYVSIFGLMLGFLWVAFDPRKQGWHDKLAGTVVIRT
jgi:uncharacterized RDD family membrane protein YckC